MISNYHSFKLSGLFKCWTRNCSTRTIFADFFIAKSWQLSHFTVNWCFVSILPLLISNNFTRRFCSGRLSNWQQLWVRMPWIDVTEDSEIKGPGFSTLFLRNSLICLRFWLCDDGTISQVIPTAFTALFIRCGEYANLEKREVREANRRVVRDSHLVSLSNQKFT